MSKHHYALSQSGAAAFMQVRIEAARAAFLKLSAAFVDESESWLSEHEWYQLLNERFVLYGPALSDSVYAGSESVGMTASLFILGRPDVAVSLFAAETFSRSCRVLPGLIDPSSA